MMNVFFRQGPYEVARASGRELKAMGGRYVVLVTRGPKTGARVAFNSADAALGVARAADARRVERVRQRRARRITRENNK